MPTRRQLANAIRALSMDAVQKANSGHPGMPMGMADIAQVLWAGYLRHNPANPLWPDRDRFVISNGHGSMLLYSLLYLTGYPMPLEALRIPSGLDLGSPMHRIRRLARCVVQYCHMKRTAPCALRQGRERARAALPPSRP